MHPLVTISIPIYKCEDFIAKTLLSVKEQTYPYLEVILVNDVTPDHSIQIAQDFIEKNQLQTHWKIINLEQNSGLSVVRNKGIDAATGKYIFYLDSDDEIVPTAIENFVKLAEKHQAEMTVGEVKGIKLPSMQEIPVFPLKVEDDILQENKTILAALVNGDFPVSSWNKLIRLDFLRNNRLYFTQGLFAQDSLHTFEMALLLKKVAFLHQQTYLYYLHDNSVIHNRKAIHFENWITIANKINDSYIAEKESGKKTLIKKYLIDFKYKTLVMNWRAQKNEQLWKRSYSAYARLKGLTIFDYFSATFSKKQKKENLFIALPVDLGYRLFKWRYER